ncbi:type IV pilus assembly protein FimV [Vogesella oryzae]|uniref:type IV pilus assembly protein FimV n=1 Tax=Vogesella oryzae TaxID=1735285 RepID=UPI001581EE86|nr:pilus assembly protein FimV [Vogesella oryzae]
MCKQLISKLGKSQGITRLVKLFQVGRSFVPPQDRGIDPVAEAEIFLSYGKRKEALRVLLYTVQVEPENLSAQLLLLQTHAYLLDVHSYVELAQQLQPRLAHLSVWEVVAAEGRELAPHHPLFQ